MGKWGAYAPMARPDPWKAAGFAGFRYWEPSLAIFWASL